MPAALQTAPGAVPFATTLSRIVTRIAAALNVAESVIRVCAAPDANMVEYLSEQGIVLRVRPPEPSVLSGADRRAYLTDRAVDAFVVSENLRDPGGRNDAAVVAHLAREEAVIDAVHGQPPVGTPQAGARIGVTIKWTPGGSEIFRRAKTDEGLYLSVVPFVVTYQQPLTVLIGTTP